MHVQRPDSRSALFYTTACLSRASLHHQQPQQTPLAHPHVRIRFLQLEEVEAIEDSTQVHVAELEQKVATAEKNLDITVRTSLDARSSKDVSAQARSPAAVFRLLSWLACTLFCL